MKSMNKISPANRLGTPIENAQSSDSLKSTGPKRTAPAMNSPKVGPCCDMDSVEATYSQIEVSSETRESEWKPEKKWYGKVGVGLMIAALPLAIVATSLMVGMLAFVVGSHIAILGGIRPIADDD